MSVCLQKRCFDWATRFPFSEAAKLLDEFCGSPLLSEDTIWRMVQKEAKRHDSEQEEVICAVQKRSEEDLPLPHFVAVTDVYEGLAPEFVCFRSSPQGRRRTVLL